MVFLVLFFHSTQGVMRCGGLKRWDANWELIDSASSWQTPPAPGCHRDRLPVWRWWWKREGRGVILQHEYIRAVIVNEIIIPLYVVNYDYFFYARFTLWPSARSVVWAFRKRCSGHVVLDGSRNKPTRVGLDKEKRVFWMATWASKPCQMVLSTRTTLFAFTVDVDRGTAGPRPVSNTELTADAGSPPPSCTDRPAV